MLKLSAKLGFRLSFFPTLTLTDPFIPTVMDQGIFVDKNKSDE